MIAVDVIRARRACLCRINTIGAAADAEQQLLLEEEVGTLVSAYTAAQDKQVIRDKMLAEIVERETSLEDLDMHRASSISSLRKYYFW
jgi:hypothetical protein